MSNFFIDSPIVALVIAVLLVIGTVVGFCITVLTALTRALT